MFAMQYSMFAYVVFSIQIYQEMSTPSHKINPLCIFGISILIDYIKAGESMGRSDLTELLREHSQQPREENASEEKPLAIFTKIQVWQGSVYGYIYFTRILHASRG